MLGQATRSLSLETALGDVIEEEALDAVFENIKKYDKRLGLYAVNSMSEVWDAWFAVGGGSLNFEDSEAVSSVSEAFKTALGAVAPTLHLVDLSIKSDHILIRTLRDGQERQFEAIGRIS